MHSDEEGIVDTVRTDAMGFCNPDRDAYAAPRFDVVAIGDSFTWCTSVHPSDAWPAQLEQLTGLTTYNLGLPGRGLHEYVQVLEAYGLAKHPRFVVMDVYEGNDLRDAYYAWAALCDAQRALERSFLGRHSYATNLVAGAAWDLALSAEKHDIVFRYEVRFPGGKELEFNTNNADRDEVQFARRLREGQLGPDLMEDALASFLALAREHGFVPVVVYTPSAYTAYEELSHFDDPGIEADMRAYSRTLRAWFASQASQRGFAYVDTTPALQAEARRAGPAELLYFRSNVHLTRWGHAVVAREVAGLIERLRWSPHASR
jgi:lysophospholipase L1-like esterase